MKIVRAGFEVYDPTDQQINGRAVERAEMGARLCYKSEAGAAEGGAADFVKKVAKRGHGSVLEHGPVYFYFLDISRMAESEHPELMAVYHSRFTLREVLHAYTNLRVIHDCYPPLFEAIIRDQPLGEFGVRYFTPTVDDPHRAVSVLFTIDRGVSHEMVRNRGAWPGNAFSQVSTRYVNYSKDRFGKEITFVDPLFWMPKPEDTAQVIASEMAKYSQWQAAMESAEETYMSLIEQGASPQEARSVLPNSTMTQVLMTSSLEGWREFLRLRADAPAHPQMREVAVPLLQWFQQNVSAQYFDLNIKI